jgi:DNA-binding LacI/PurR family transcriptional regulator
MTYSVVEPHVHRVVTHHFDNAVRTFALLEERGFRRIGLAMTHDMEFRANHSYSGAYFRRNPKLQKILPILFIEDSGARVVRSWYEKHRPDAVVVANAHQVKDFLRPALGSKICARTAFVCLDYEEGTDVPGIDQLFETIGSHSVDALVAQIHRSEHGIPENPTIAMVEGHWVEGPRLLQPRKLSSGEANNYAVRE